MMLIPNSEYKRCSRDEDVLVIYGDRSAFSGEAGQKEGKVETMKFSCSRTEKGEVAFYPELVNNIHSETLCADCDIIKLAPPQ